ncbi:ABC-type multidrug transport system fused ATPase/permease subunit [Streptomyces sp. V3I8]|nr:ABC-type multidrug transport system fused ATPase/permease subunit [Streptomyces sp. V3I8]
MSTLDLRTHRRFVSVVPQESILFDGTVREIGSHEELMSRAGAYTELHGGQLA